MKWQSPKFRALQAAWYGLLEAAGFVDAERLVCGEPMLRQFSSRLRERRSEAYYALLRQRISDTVWERESDRIILTMYADGCSVADILQTLQLMPPRIPPRFRSPYFHCRRNRQTIRFVIRKYEMQWGLRTYSRQELGDYRRQDAS